MITRCDKRRVQSWSIAALGSFTFLVCYLRSFRFPNVPFLLWGDALGYATKSVRILGGEWPHRDFFDLLTPGTELVYAVVFRCIGVALWVPNLLMCVLATLTSLWVTWCARRLMHGNFARLPGLLVTGFVLAGSFDATHHWFSTLFVMAAVAVYLMGLFKPTPRGRCSVRLGLQLYAEQGRGRAGVFPHLSLVEIARGTSAGQIIQKASSAIVCCRCSRVRHRQCSVRRGRRTASLVCRSVCFSLAKLRLRFYKQLARDGIGVC